VHRSLRVHGQVRQSSHGNEEALEFGCQYQGRGGGGGRARVARRVSVSRRKGTGEREFFINDLLVRFH
jgi:hypothetical protein